MSFPGHARVVEKHSGERGLPLWNPPSTAGTFDFHLPILAQSVALLRVLSQDGILDLDLVSSVIALDPGLAYGVLQLANRDLPDNRDRVWQLPLAIVTAGRANLDELLDQAWQIDFASSDGSALHNLLSEAVLRAALAHCLACELASGSPRKCYLSGLLSELPALVACTDAVRIDSQATLLSDMCHSLPVTIVKAALAPIALHTGPSDSMSAIVLIAQELLHAARRGDSSLEELAGRPFWKPWSVLSMLQRKKILQRCSEVSTWVSKNLYHVHPWEFMAQLESQTCEPLCKR